MTSPLYQSTPVLLPGAVTTDFDAGVASVSVAPQILEGHGDPTSVVTAPAGSFFTDVDTSTVYANSDGTDTGWQAISATSPLTTAGDLFTHSTLDTRLPVGTNTQMLVVDTAQPTKLKWQAQPDLSGFETIAAATATYEPITKNPILATVADGDTFNFNFGRPYLLHLAADAATFTININKPANGQVVRFAFDHAIAAVTWNSVGVANGYVGAPAAIATGDAFAWIYDSSGDKYWPYKG